MLPEFASPRLAEALEALRAEDLDRLPFGAIRLGPDGVVLMFNKTEAEQSGYHDRPVLGRTFFTDVAPCMNNGYFKGRIERAQKAGTLDISFSFLGDFSDRDRELNVRVQTAPGGGTWIFIQRPTIGRATA